MSKTTKHDSMTNTPEAGDAEEARPIAHPLLAEIAITLAAAVLRNLVVNALERGKIVQTKEDQDRLKTSPSRRLAAMGVKRLATRSVPGALAVGVGIVAQSLFQKRKSRKSLPAPPAPAEDSN